VEPMSTPWVVARQKKSRRGAGGTEWQLRHQQGARSWSQSHVVPLRANPKD
jgi:hypothetical protein